MNQKKYLLTTIVAMTIAVNTVLSQDYNNIKVEIGAGKKYSVSQKQAEKALAKLSQTADIEDSWIFYNGSLIDNGIDENSESVTPYFPLIIKTDSGDTIKISIDKDKTITSYHNHPHAAPPGMFDIVNHSILVDSIFPNNHVISKVAEDGRIWEFSIDDKLRLEFRGKNPQERFDILESKINKAYDKVDNYFGIGPIQAEYHPEISRKGYKEYVRIMKKVGVKAKYYRP